MNYKRVIIKDTYLPSDYPTSVLEKNAQKDNVTLNYNDDNQIIIPNNIYTSPIIISSKFFEANKDIIIEATKKYIFTPRLAETRVEKYAFSDELFAEIVNNPKNKYVFCDITLSKQQIEILKANYIPSSVNDECSREIICDGNLFSGYSKEKLSKEKHILLDYNMSLEELENLKYLPDDKVLNLRFNNKLFDKFDVKNGKEDYYKQVFKIINKLEALGKGNEITIDVFSRNKFSQYLPKIKKLKLKVITDGQEYEYEDYLKEEEILENLVKDIKKSEMSPFEKYLAVYNIVANFKPYKEADNKLEARELRYILNNEYIVCVGYSELLITLLDKVGIESRRYSCAVDISHYSEGKGAIPLEFGHHSRVLFSLKDGKYGINGYYVADPTWDNLNKEGLFNHAIMPFNKMQYSKMQFKQTEIDYFFDIDNFEDYCKKVNILFGKKLNKCPDLALAYKEITISIMSVIRNIDSELYERLEPLFIKVTKNYNESEYDDLITEIGYAIVEKTNKKVGIEQLKLALMEIKKNLVSKDLMVDHQHYMRELKAREGIYFLDESTFDSSNIDLEEKRII